MASGELVGAELSAMLKRLAGTGISAEDAAVELLTAAQGDIDAIAEAAGLVLGANSHRPDWAHIRGWALAVGADPDAIDEAVRVGRARLGRRHSTP